MIWVLVIVVIVIGMIEILILGLVSFSAEATASDFFVAPSGRDVIPFNGFYLINDYKNPDEPCLSIQHAINQAQVKDTIHVASGIHTSTRASVITLVNPIAVMGGWDGDGDSPLIHNPILYLTILDGERTRQVVVINRDISPTLYGFIICNGYASGIRNNGGGIYILDSYP